MGTGLDEAVARHHDPLLEFGRIHDPDQLHVGPRGRAVARRLHLGDAQVEPPQDLVVDEGQVLDILQRNRLFRLEEVPFGKPQLAGRQLALQALLALAAHPSSLTSLKPRKIRRIK